MNVLPFVLFQCLQRYVKKKLFLVCLYECFTCPVKFWAASCTRFCPNTHIMLCAILLCGTWKVKPDLYYEKSLRHALRQALRQGKPLSQAVASCRNGSSQKLSQVQLLRRHALQHGTRHALRHGKPRSQAGRWLIMCVFH